MSCLIYDWTDSDEKGNDGWLARGYPNFDASTARVIAHDCVDHLPRGQKHGPYADELLALGARLWVWVESGAFFRPPRISYASPPQIWGGEIMFVVRDQEDAGDPMPATITEPLLDDCLDAEIEGALIEFCRRHTAENHIDLNDPNEPRYTLESPEVQNLGAWLRRGVRAARKRYKGHNPADVHNLYERVVQEVEKIRSGQQGDKLIVRIHEKRLDVSVRLVSWRNQHE